MARIYRLSKGDEATTTGTSIIKVKTGLLQLLGDTTVSGASVQNITFSGLTGDTDKTYFLVMFGIDDTTVTNLGLRFNGDTGNNYIEQNIEASSTTVSSYTNTLSYGFFIYLAANAHGIAQVWIHSLSGYQRWATYTCGSSVPTSFMGSIRWTNTADQITSITIHAAGGAVMKAGTRVVLFKQSS